jgi:histidinol-phosphate/aromatic aminotransferase/cobyric acid decarboxylase-like protein
MDAQIFSSSPTLLIVAFFLGGAYFRVAVRRRQENLRLIVALAEWLASWGK